MRNFFFILFFFLLFSGCHINRDSQPSLVSDDVVSKTPSLEAAIAQIPTMTLAATTVATPSSSFTPTPKPTPTLTPTNTLTPTPTNTPSITPTPLPTAIGGGAGDLIAACYEKTGGQGIYIYDLEMDEFDLLRPEYNRSLDSLESWQDDFYFSISEDGNYIFERRCNREDVDLAWRNNTQFIIGSKNVNCRFFISSIDFSNSLSNVRTDQPGGFELANPAYWADDEFALYVESGKAIDEDDRLYVGDPTKNERLFIASSSYFRFFPSPDKKYIAIPIMIDDPVNEGTLRIFDHLLILDRGRNTAEKLYFPEVELQDQEGVGKAVAIGNISWHPRPGKSTFLVKVVIQSKVGNVNSYSGAIYEVDVSSLEITPFGDGSNVAYSPDGSRIAIERYDNGWKIFIVDQEGTILDIFDHKKGRAGLDEIFWSSDGEKLILYYTLVSPTTREVRILDLTAAELKTIIRYENIAVLLEDVKFSSDGSMFLLGAKEITSRICSGHVTDCEKNSWLLCDSDECRIILPPNVTSCENVDWR